MTEKLEFENGLFYIIPTNILRETPNVLFTKVPVLQNLEGIDHVIHGKNAVSPSIKNKENETFWYMHTNQDDNLMVISGLRKVELYTKDHGNIAQITVTKDFISYKGNKIYEGEAILGWKAGVFHRVMSGEDGSNSINFAVRDNNFDIKNNFNIYDLDISTGEHNIVREGFKDQ